ncbi:hypothetical protein B2G74_21970, partial [Burkholderia sp. A27]
APSKPGDPLQSWRCEPLSLPTFFAAAKKVGAAPHRGNANRPLTNQGKAKKPTPKTKPPSRPNPTYIPLLCRRQLHRSATFTRKQKRPASNSPKPQPSKQNPKFQRRCAQRNKPLISTPRASPNAARSATKRP